MNKAWVNQGIQAIQREIERYDNAHRENAQGKLSDAELLYQINHAYREIGTWVLMLHGHGITTLEIGDSP